MCAALCDIQVHEDEMADASAEHKQMEDLMGTEILVLAVKDRKF